MSGYVGRVVRNGSSYAGFLQQRSGEWQVTRLGLTLHEDLIVLDDTTFKSMRRIALVRSDGTVIVDEFAETSWYGKEVHAGRVYTMVGE